MELRVYSHAANANQILIGAATSQTWADLNLEAWRDVELISSLAVNDKGCRNLVRPTMKHFQSLGYEITWTRTNGTFRAIDDTGTVLATGTYAESGATLEMDIKAIFRGQVFVGRALRNPQGGKVMFEPVT